VISVGIEAEISSFIGFFSFRTYTVGWDFYRAVSLGTFDVWMGFKSKGTGQQIKRVSLNACWCHSKTEKRRISDIRLRYVVTMDWKNQYWNLGRSELQNLLKLPKSKLRVRLSRFLWLILLSFLIVLVCQDRSESISIKKLDSRQP